MPLSDLAKLPADDGASIDRHRTVERASVGIAYADHVNETELFAHADMALYCAKSAGRSAYRLYVPAMSRRRATRLADHGAA